jgi:hypothetical protein
MFNPKNGFNPNGPSTYSADSDAIRPGIPI